VNKTVHRGVRYALMSFALSALAIPAVFAQNAANVGAPVHGPAGTPPAQAIAATSATKRKAPAATRLAQAAPAGSATKQTSADMQLLPTTPGSANSGPTLEAIQITATRVQRAGFVAPTPTMVLSAQVLQIGGPTNIGQSLTYMPSYSPTTSAGSTTENVDTDQNTANLRGLGASETLVMIDGARPVTTAPSGSAFGFDLNLIPAFLVKRVEVVTGGGSADWGSDAVAGVVNIEMNNSFQGFKADAQYGSDTEGYGSNNYTADAAYGTMFANGRGHIMFGVGYYQQNRVCCLYSSAAGRDGLIPNPNYTPTNGQPQELFVQNLLNNDASVGGLITSGPLKGTNFGSGGSISQFQYGQYGLDPSSGGEMVGGDPSARLYPSSSDSLISPDERESFYGSASYDVTDHTTLSFDLLAGHEESNGAFYDAAQLGTIKISNTNAYLPTEIANEMTADNITSFNLGRDDADFGPVFNDVANTTVQFWLRATGDLGDGWTWDTFYSYGQNQRRDAFGNQPITANFANSVNAVTSPTTGQPVCAIALTNPSTNCVPVDLFGPGAPSAAALSYFEGTSEPRTLLTQDEAAANLHGEPFSIWAGPVSIATGVELRYEAVTATVDPITRALGFSQINIAYLTPGNYNVAEGYLETVAPLARGLPGLQKLDFDGAVRVSDYSTSGVIPSWKLGLTDNVTDDFLLRGTYSADIRAPDLFELYDAISTSHGNVINPLTNIESTDVTELTGGNAKLLPENARTWTVGTTYQPRWLNGLGLSVDWYSIKITNTIGTLGAQEIVDQCYQGQIAAACAEITTANGAISVIRSTEINFSSEAASGIDMEADYASGLSALHLPGHIALQWLANYVDTLYETTGTTIVPTAGLAGDPRWRSTLSAMYTLSPITVTGRVRYYSGGAFTYTQTVNTDVPPQTYVDIGLEWKLPMSGVSVYGNLDNVFNNVDAKAASYGNGSEGEAGGGLYDTVGRVFNIGFRLDF
jgi:iron complex outermembrane recepter protein